MGDELPAIGGRRLAAVALAVAVAVAVAVALNVYDTRQCLPV
jgi:hypothetical protein